MRLILLRWQGTRWVLATTETFSSAESATNYARDLVHAEFSLDRQGRERPIPGFRVAPFPEVKSPPADEKVLIELRDHRLHRANGF